MQQMMSAMHGVGRQGWLGNTLLALVLCAFIGLPLAEASHFHAQGDAADSCLLCQHASDSPVACLPAPTSFPAAASEVPVAVSSVAFVAIGYRQPPARAPPKDS